MRASDPSLIRVLSLAFGLAAGVGCGHPLLNGTYDFVPVGAPSEDACGLAPADGGLWEGQLSTSGEEVFLNLAIPVNGQATVTTASLTGFFKAPQYGAADGFVVDATLGPVPAPVSGMVGGCPSDSAVLHLDAETQDDSHFSGTLHAEYDLSPQAAGSSCATLPSHCVLDVKVAASLINTNH